MAENKFGALHNFLVDAEKSSAIMPTDLLDYSIHFNFKERSMATNPFSDVTKLFGEFKTPDFNQAFSYGRRNAETFSAVCQIFAESAQSSAKLCAEMLRDNTDRALKASKALLNPSSPENSANKQADFLRDTAERNVNGLREIAEINTKAAQEAFDEVSKLLAQSLSDVASGASQATKKKAA